MAQPSELLDAWFDASDADSLARAEDAILAASAGPSSGALAIDIAPADAMRARASVADLDALGVEREWLTNARIYEGGPRCTAIFGPLGDASRRERLAHVPFAFELRHPTIDAPMRLVPVPPPAMRPPVFADGVWGAPAIDAHLCWIARWAQILAGREDVGELSPHALEPLLESIRALLDGGSELRCSRWTRHEAMPPIPPSSPCPPDEDELRLVLSSIALDGDRLALDNGQITIVDLADEGSLARFDARGAQLEAILGPLLLFTANAEWTLPESDEDGGGVIMVTRHHALDTRDRSWTAWPEDMPRVSFEEAFERTYLSREDGAAARLHEVADYPVTNVFTTDRRFAWAEDKEGSGGVFRARDGAYVASFAQSFDGELENGTAYLDNPHAGFRPYEGGEEGEDEDEDEDEHEHEHEHEQSDPLRAPREAGPTVAAIAVRSDAVLTYRHGIVARNGVPWFGLALPIDVAAFDVTGEHLAVHIAAKSIDPPALLVFDLRGDEPVLAHHRTLRG